MSGKSIDFEKFEEELSKLDTIEKSQTAEEKQCLKDRELLMEILNEWNDTTRISEHKPEEYARLMKLFVENVNTWSEIHDGYACMFNTIQKANRCAVKKRIL